MIAVISAALSALMGLAMGKLNKAKQDVAAATGVSSSKGRVAAGMLTYAEGDYPVLGNDGQIYNARYQKELKRECTAEVRILVFSLKRSLK